MNFPQTQTTDDFFTTTASVSKPGIVTTTHQQEDHVVSWSQSPWYNAVVGGVVAMTLIITAGIVLSLAIVKKCHKIQPV